MTNNFQVYGLAYNRNYTGWGGSLPVPYHEKPTSVNRSLVAADMTGRALAEKNLTAPAVFVILSSVAQERGAPGQYTSATLTQWSVVYDLRNLTMEWQVHDDATQYSVAMDEVAFCNGSAVRMIPLRPAAAGDVSGLVPPCAATTAGPGPTVPATRSAASPLPAIAAAGITFVVLAIGKKT